MKIAVLGIRGLPANYSGFETCAEHVTKDWAAQGHHVLVYCRGKSAKNGRNSYNNCELKYAFCIKSKYFETLSHTFFSIIHLILLERKFEYVHLYNAGNAIYLPILKLFGKKCIVSVDGLEWKRDKWGSLAKIMFKMGEQCAAKWADKVIVDNAVVEKYYRDKYSIRPKLIAYGAKLLDTGDKETEQKVLQKYSLVGKKYFIFVGRLVPEKGVHNLVSVYKRLETDLPLVIIGDDYNGGEYRDSLFKFQTKNIKFLGFKYGEEYECLLKNSLMYVSASTLEGTSPSLLAAMGAGVCTLVNGIEENRSAIGDAGYFFKNNDMISFYEQWSKLIRNRQEIFSMAEKGKEYVCNRYSWNTIAKEYIETMIKL